MLEQINTLFSLALKFATLLLIGTIYATYGFNENGWPGNRQASTTNSQGGAGCDVDFTSSGGGGASMSAYFGSGDSSARGSYRARGLDISHYQGDLLPKLQPADSVSFVFIKATEGINYVDPDFSTNWKDADSLGYARGPYHFYHSNDDPAEQAHDFLAAIGDLAPPDLPPVLDIEQQSIKSDIDPLDFQAGVKVWLDSVEKATDLTPIIYASPSFANEYLIDSTFARYPLWVADWTNASEPEIPNIWKSAGWAFWQQSDSRIIEGTTVDWDIFNGSKYQLLSFVRKSDQHSD